MNMIFAGNLTALVNDCFACLFMARVELFGSLFCGWKISDATKTIQNPFNHQRSHNVPGYEFVFAGLISADHNNPNMMPTGQEFGCRLVRNIIA